jgi:poly-gamma-glutamate synthesis protein (capsule biosynthesis protein)
MISDIAELRSQCDVLVVAFHKGLGHTPAKLAYYEKEIAHSAIDSGADVILSHHAHIGRGVEVYKGKPVFHGLGNFVTVTRALSAEGNRDRQAWAWRRKELFGFEPDPEYPPYYSFHPESKYTMIAKFIVEDSKVSKVSYLPCLINKRAQPEVLRNDERGREVFEYFEKITRMAGLNALYAWEGDEVAIGSAE